METNSVFIFKSPSPKSMSIVSQSPQNNPFDDLLKKTIDTAKMSEWKNRNSSLQFAGNFPDVDRQSLSFHELNASDLGRESLGILPPDFGKESLGFMNTSSFEIGRESLGILQINALRESLSFRRESLGILNLTDFGRESLDCGRESLGILHVNSPDIRFGDEDKKIPDIILTTIDENSNCGCNPFDMAFINSYSRKSSAASSAASSVPSSFNSYNLEGPSAIYPLSIKKSEDGDKSDVLNRAFINTNEFSLFSAGSLVHSPWNKSILNSIELYHNVRSKIHSLPEALQENSESFNGATGLGFTDRKFWTADRALKTKSVDRTSFHGILDFDDLSNDFSDSVFIEGQYLAQKIADGSILNDSSGSQIGILDCTPEPNWPGELSYNEENKDVKCDTETVFKAVDKMLPPPSKDMKFKLKTSKTDSNSSNENDSYRWNVSKNSKLSQGSDNDNSGASQNISNITRDSDKNSMSHKARSASRDAKEILHNLSEILSCTHPSDQQKSEGQNLLTSLADMLSENNSRHGDPDDSGHSSINEQESPVKENIECFEVLDLRAKSDNESVSKDESANKNAALDLSLKSVPKKNVEQRLTRSLSSRKSIPLSVANKKNLTTVTLDMNSDTNKNRSSSINSSANSNNSKVSDKSRISIAGKLRQKPVNSNIKKGPMKAVIPVGDMKKRCSLAVTPERTLHALSVMQSKKTSTPINESKLRPVAASTPAGRPVRDRKEVANSPLERIKKIDASPTSRRDTIGSATSSLPIALNKDSKLLRRNSVSEVKKSESFGRTKRSNSFETETGIMSSLAKVRQNIINSPYYQLKKQGGLKESNLTETDNKARLDRSKGLPIGRTSQSISKLRTPGKENAWK